MGEKFITYTKHGVAESTLLKSTKVGHQYNLVSDVDIDNGSVAVIGDYVKSDLFEAAIPAKEDKIVLILTAPKIYAEYTKKMQEESNFFNEAGETMRAYEIQDTDRFTLSKEAFDADALPAVGQFVTVNETDYKLTTAGTTLPTGFGFIGKIYAVAANGNYRIIVKRNMAVEAAEI